MKYWLAGPLLVLCGGCETKASSRYPTSPHKTTTESKPEPIPSAFRGILPGTATVGFTRDSEHQCSRTFSHFKQRGTVALTLKASGQVILSAKTKAESNGFDKASGQHYQDNYRPESCQWQGRWQGADGRVNMAFELAQKSDGAVWCGYDNQPDDTSFLMTCAIEAVHASASVDYHDSATRRLRAVSCNFPGSAPTLLSSLTEPRELVDTKPPHLVFAAQPLTIYKSKSLWDHRTHYRLVASEMTPQ